jgi:hypothetical protein
MVIEHCALYSYNYLYPICGLIPAEAVNGHAMAGRRIYTKGRFLMRMGRRFFFFHPCQLTVSDQKAEGHPKTQRTILGRRKKANAALTTLLNNVERVRLKA